MTNSGVHYEISIAGIPRTYRDRLDYATEAAALLKGNNPHSEIAVRDLRTNERTVIQLPRNPIPVVVKMHDPHRVRFSALGVAWPNANRLPSIGPDVFCQGAMVDGWSAFRADD